jgi:hypothetical protein
VAHHCTDEGRYVEQGNDDLVHAPIIARPRRFCSNG